MVMAQEESLRLLSEYLATGSSEKRLRVANVVGDNEILASRIYKWFWTWARRGVPSEEKEIAKRFLLENPHLTLRVLRPLLLEDPDSSYDGVYMSDAQEVYLNLCSYIASVEEDGVALEWLSSIASNSRAVVAKSATDIRNFVATSENYRAKSESYRTEKQWRDLDWLGQKKLKVGMSEDQVRQLLGKPQFEGKGVGAYAGTAAEGDTYYLWVTFFDGSLEAWGMGGAPPAAAEIMAKKLIRER